MYTLTKMLSPFIEHTVSVRLTMSTAIKELSYTFMMPTLS